MNAAIQWRSYLRVAVPLIILAAALGQLALWSTFVMGHATVYGLVPMFLLNAEANIPTFLSAINLVLAGVLLLVIGACARQARQPFAFAWTALALIAAFLAFDEAAQIHESLDRHREWTIGLFKATGPLAGPWVVVYGAVVVAVMIGFARFFMHLPARYKLLFAAGAGLFVTASIGLEMVGATVWSTQGKSYLFEGINWAEEVLEMTAVTLVNASLLSYIQVSFGSLNLQVTRPGIP